MWCLQRRFSISNCKKTKAIKFKKKLYALDTFKGHPYDDYENMSSDLRHEAYGDRQPRTYKGKLGDVNFNKVKKWFLKEELENTIFLKGLFEESFKSISDKKFCFAHVDADTYLSVKQCIEFLRERMVSGGIILFDDYNAPRLHGCNKAVDDLLGLSSLTILKPYRAFWIKP